MFSLCARLAAGRHYLGRQLRHLLTDPSTWQHVPWCALSAACPVTCRPAVEIFEWRHPSPSVLAKGVNPQPATRWSALLVMALLVMAGQGIRAECGCCFARLPQRSAMQGVRVYTRNIVWCGVLYCVVHCVECPWSCDYGVNGRLSLDRLLRCGGYLTHSHTLLMQFNTAGTCPDEVPRCSAALLPTHAAVLQEIRALVGQFGVEEVVS